MSSISRRGLARSGAIGVLSLVVAVVVVATVLSGFFDVSVSTLPYAIVGTAIVWQRPRTHIGWVLLIFGLLWSATFLGAQLTSAATNPAVVVVAAWLSEWTWFPALVSVFVVLPILFPTGRPTSAGWRWVLRVAVAICVLFALFTSVQARFNPNEGQFVDNPVGLLGVDDIEALLVPAAIPLLVLGPTAALARFRRATGVERQQIRWFMYAAVACGVVFLANALVQTVAAGVSAVVSEAAFVAALSLPPLGIWVAVTRHRLYDIDRLISRTVSYGLLTALLLGVFVGSVFVLSAVIPVEGDLPVAASTLLVAALFNPLRRRIQETVDRRFNRARYNARRLVENFSRRLRVDVGVEAIGAELRDTVVFTMQPRTLSLWLRDPRLG